MHATRLRPSLAARTPRCVLLAGAISSRLSLRSRYTGTEKSSTLVHWYRKVFYGSCRSDFVESISSQQIYTHTHTHTHFLFYFFHFVGIISSQKVHTHKYIHTHTHTHTVSMAGARGERQGHGRPHSTKTLNPKLNPKLNQAREEREARARHANLGQNLSRMLRGADRAPNQSSRRELQ